MFVTLAIGTEMLKYMSLIFPSSESYKKLLAKTDNINILELLIDTIIAILGQRRAKQCYTSMSLYGWMDAVKRTVNI